MNTEEIHALADHLERVWNDAQFFSMHEFFADFDKKTEAAREGDGTYTCTSPSCMAGHYLFMKGVNTFNINKPAMMEYKAGDMLALPVGHARRLFMPELAKEGYDDSVANPELTNPYNANAKQCAWLLREYAKTGEIKWQEALKQ